MKGENKLFFISESCLRVTIKCWRNDYLLLVDM